MKVICPGELLIDFICTDRDTSLLNSTNFIKKAGGAPANVAVAIAKMGVESSVLASVGDDQFGDFLIEKMRRYGVDTSNIMKLNNAHTTLAFVSLTSDGERDFRFMRSADKMYHFDLIPKELLEESKVIHFGSAMAFLEGELQSTYYKLLQYAIQNNKTITFDPNYREALFGDKKEVFKKHSKEFIRYSDIVKVSLEEAEIITGIKDIELAAKKINQLGAKYVLVTLGEKGTLISSTNNLEYIQTVPVKMVDATGAGDAFIGAVIAKIAQSKNITFDILKRFVEFGNRVGAETVKKYGALDSIPAIDELN